MKLFGGITVNDDGVSVAIRGMRAEMKLLNYITKNISNFGVAGYQKKVGLKTSFSEYIGSHGVEGITDSQPGRMRRTGYPLDFIIENKGYFQVETQNGIKLTRDGRFQIDKDGYLITLNNEKVLGSDGESIQFNNIPGDLKDINVDQDGTINLYNKTYKKKEYINKIGIASSDGTPIQDVSVKQGYIEDSNVNLAEEFFTMMPIRRNFEASRQTFIMQSDNINKLIQMLGRSQ